MKTLSVFAVALHPEGVDRNYKNQLETTAEEVSPSTRRAWIEMVQVCLCLMRAESPSTRRAWIEMCTDARAKPPLLVALHPEGVDRNFTLTLDPERIDVALHPEGVDRN